MENGPAHTISPEVTAVSPFLRASMRALARTLPRTVRPAGPSGRRAVILHLDGLSLHALAAGMHAGAAPFLSRLLAQGTHRLDPYLVGAPASTSAFQAGLLYGKVDDVPGYLWYDRRTKKIARMNHGEWCEAVEARHRVNGPGLLAGGSSYTTLFHGDADVPAMNLRDARRFQYRSHARHWNFGAALAIQMAVGARMWGRLATETLPGLTETLAWGARVGRYDWEWRLFGMKLLTSILLREATTGGVIGDVLHGMPMIYAAIVDYDEVAHRRGPTSSLALDYLRGVDRAVEIIFAAAAAVPELGYDVYVLADHGMVDAVPFPALDGHDLPAWLAAAEERGGEPARNLSLRRLGDSLPAPIGWIAHEMARKASKPPRDMEVVDAGDIAHLYFTDSDVPTTFETMTRRRPRIVEALRTAGELVPFAVARGEHGPVLIAGERTFHLCDPLQRAAAATLPAIVGREAETLIGYLERVIAMPSAGDLVLYGNAGPGKNIAFSYEFGSHGGIGREEIEAFVIAPQTCEFDFRAVRGPEALHRWFVRYRPGLPAAQRIFDREVEPSEREIAAAMASGLLPDPSADTLHTGCP